MKPGLYIAIFTSAIFTACQVETKVSHLPVEGTWKLVNATLVENGDTTLTDFTGAREMIKIINATHFSFLNHDKTDTAAVFGAGGGRYTFENGKYTEFLDYCSDRQWEGHQFDFDVEVSVDTLVQSGREVIEKLGIDRLNIEKYVRVTD